MAMKDLAKLLAEHPKKYYLPRKGRCAFDNCSENKLIF